MANKAVPPPQTFLNQLGAANRVALRSSSKSKLKPLGICRGICFGGPVALKDFLLSGACASMSSIGPSRKNRRTSPSAKPSLRARSLNSDHPTFQCSSCSGVPTSRWSGSSASLTTLVSITLLTWVMPLLVPKPKPRWDVHLLGVGNRAGMLARVPRPLTGGRSGTAASPHPSGWTARLGSFRPSPAPGT